MKVIRHQAIRFAAAIGALAAVFVLYGGRTMLATAAVVSSSAVLLAVLAHLGILAAVVAPVLAWRRRTRRRDQPRE